jgi:hypothetical protein
MTRNWSVLERELAVLQEFLRQPISARLSVLPVAFGDEEDWLEAGTRAFDQAVHRVQAGINDGIGPAVLAQPINEPLLRQGCDELRQGLEELRGVVVMGQGLEQSGLVSVELGSCLRKAAENTLGQIEVWLAELSGVLADPSAALRQRGLPTSGDVELDLVLSLKPSPALEQLREMARTMTDATPDKKPEPGWSFLKMLMVGLLLLFVLRILFDF